MNEYHDFAVIGGGLIGLTTAWGLAQKNLSVVVLEKGSLDRSGSRVYAINDATQQLLQGLNTWPDTAEKCHYKHMYVWDAKVEEAIEFHPLLLGQSSLGCIIEEQIIYDELMKRVMAHPNIKFFPETAIDTINKEDAGWSIRHDQNSWYAKWLIGADGAHSFVRQCLQVGLKSWSYDQKAIIGTVLVEKPHGDTAYQVFHEDSILALLPLANQSRCSIVWSGRPTQVDNWMKLTASAFNLNITAAFQQKLGRLSLMGDRKDYPLTMRHAEEIIGDRWVLLGDAAHTIHPLAGLGINLGFADVDLFLRTIHSANSVYLSVQQRQRYARERKARVWRAIYVMEALNLLFLNKHPIIRKLRQFGLNKINQSPLFKRLLIEEACGLNK